MSTEASMLGGQHLGHGNVVSRWSYVAFLVIVAGLSACRQARPQNGAVGSTAAAIQTSSPGVDVSDAALIGAVRRDVDGKTYPVTATRQDQQPVPCSQVDVDLDPNMPHNPELAKCPRVGASHMRMETVTYTETRRCGALPEPGPGWQVVSLGKNRWRLTYAGSAWELEEQSEEPGSKAAASPGVTSSFRITALQQC